MMPLLVKCCGSQGKYPGTPDVRQAPLAAFVNPIPSAVITQAPAAAGADVVLIDQEHGTIGPESLHAMVASTGGTTCSAGSGFRLATRPGDLMSVAGKDPSRDATVNRAAWSQV